MVLVVALAYSNTLFSPFHFDDLPNIVDNAAIHITRLTPESLFSAVRESFAINRPIANLSFALNYYFGGLNVFGYHLVNLIIHIGSALTLYLLLCRLLTLPRVPQEIREKSRLISLSCALIWAVHPIQTQSVTYIVQRMTSLCGLFYFASLLFYLKGQILLSFGFGLLSVGTKEIGALLPITMIAIDYFLISEPGSRPKRLYLGLAGLFVALSLLFLWNTTIIRDLSTGELEDHPFTVRQRLFTEARVLFFYLSLIFFPLPSRFNIDHDFPLSTALFTPWTTAASILLLLLIAPFILFSRKNFLSFLLFWYFSHLAIESSVINLKLIFEHRLYLPLMAPILGLTILGGAPPCQEVESLSPFARAPPRRRHL